VNEFWLSVGLSVVTGAVVNELSDLSPWLAVRVARLAARLRGWACSDPEWAAEYREAWPLEIQDRPGKLLKLAAALWLLTTVAVELPGRGFSHVRAAYECRKPRRHGHPRPAADPRLEKLWRNFSRAYKLLLVQSLLTGLLESFSRLLFPQFHPHIVMITLTGMLLAFNLAHRTFQELLRALRNPPGPHPTVPTRTAILMIIDHLAEQLKRMRDRLTRWMRLVRFAISTVASYS
jgi:hypothetical protein